MWSLTSTASTGSRCCKALLAWLAAVTFAAATCVAQELHVPKQAPAGKTLSIATEGSGDATFYLFGPDVRDKRGVKLGQEISVSPDDLHVAGKYLALLCTGACQKAEF